jgi:hypothetical protein
MYKIIGADQKEYGPVSGDELRKWMAEGRANGQTLVQEDGGSWKPLSSCPEFGASVPSPAPPLAPPPPGLAPAVITPPPPSITPVSRTHVMAVAGLVMGILSVTLGLCCCYGLPFNLLGIVFSAVALVQIKNDPEHYQGRGLAIAGLALSVLSFLLVGLLLVIGVAFSWGDIMRGLKR